MHKSVYNYKIDEDRKLEEIFPSAEFTNRHENAKGLALKASRKEPALNPNLKTKNMANWIKNVISYFSDPFQGRWLEKQEDPKHNRKLQQGELQQGDFL